MTRALIGPCRISPPCIHQHITIIGLSERRPRMGKHGVFSTTTILGHYIYRCYRGTAAAQQLSCGSFLLFSEMMVCMKLFVKLFLILSEAVSRWFINLQGTSQLVKLKRAQKSYYLPATNQASLLIVDKPI